MCMFVHVTQLTDNYFCEFVCIHTGGNRNHEKHKHVVNAVHVYFQ